MDTNYDISSATPVVSYDVTSAERYDVSSAGNSQVIHFAKPERPAACWQPA